MKKPTTIGGQWDLFYSKFPAIYDRFSIYEDSENKIFKFIGSKVDLKDKIILDVGAGTGRYSILFSQAAKKVYALEPSSAMRETLKQKIEKGGITNISLINENVQDFELPNEPVDVVFSSWVLSGIYGWQSNISNGELRQKGLEMVAIINKLEKVLKKNGWIIVVETAPGQYGGELQPLILGSSDDFSGNFTGWLAKEFNFEVTRKDVSFNFKSVAEAAELFGFVYGEKVMKHIIKERIRSVKMEVYIMIKEVKK